MGKSGHVQAGELLVLVGGFDALCAILLASLTNELADLSDSVNDEAVGGAVDAPSGILDILFSP